MNKRILQFLTLAIILAPLAVAQRWEFGAGAGGGFNTSQDVNGAPGGGSVTITPGMVASAWLDNNRGNRWGGELRYDYQMGDLQVSSQSTKASFSAQTHGIHYDFLLHTAPQEARVRPFIALGGGVKMYSGTGTEVASQPLNQLALLTKTSEVRGMLSVGGGVKINRGRFGFRIEAHDFITQFPNKVIAPAQGVSIGGWLHDLVVSAGISVLL
jgi:hypothetical protein